MAGMAARTVGKDSSGPDDTGLAEHARRLARTLLIALHADASLGRGDRTRMSAEVLRRSVAEAAMAAEAGTQLSLLEVSPVPLPPPCPSGIVTPSRRRRSPAPPWPTAEAAAELATAAEAALAAVGGRFLTLLDGEYPPLLASIPCPPPVLAVRGTIPAGPAVAIVGSRLGDAYGREVASRFARSLARAGVAVISGMARGIDTAAHEGAVAAHGPTMAVLGSGLGAGYSPGYERLAAAIADHGALISEFPCTAPPRRWHFPRRNRAIAGLCAATLVVQATPRSGSLNTARHASDLGRQVFAVPGPIFDPLSSGPHLLLRDGARLATHPLDLLEALGVE